MDFFLLVPQPILKSLDLHISFQLDGDLLLFCKSKLVFKLVQLSGVGVEVLLEMLDLVVFLRVVLPSSV